MKIITKQLNKLIPYENNPRLNDNAVDAVANSIREFGFKVPIIITRDNVIVAGHTRLKAALKLGIDEVPCIVADDLTDAQIKAFRLADNKVGELAEWDFDKLDIEMEDLGDLGFNMEDFGFGLNTEDDAEAKEDNYDVESAYEEIEEPITKKGDIWILGKHRVMCGDSTSEFDVDKLMNGETADLLVTDPPYNVNYGSKAEAINDYGYNFSDRHIENDYMPDYLFLEFLTKAFKCAKDNLKPGGSYYIWHASTTVLEFEQALRENGLQTRQQIIWVKNALVLSRQDYHWKHEPCLYGWKEGAAHYFIDDRTLTTVYEDAPIDFKKMKKDELVKLLEDIYVDKISTTIINENKPTRSDMHPTMKPIKLIARLIRNSSHLMELVLDLFGGSGSTLIAAEQLNRKSNLMELDPKYVDVIVDRYIALCGEDSVYLERNGERISYAKV